jgi:hypothetical protein
MATETQSPLTETWDQIDRQFRFLIDRVLAQHGSDNPEMSLVMTCPEYPDSPIIAAMQGFENVCGRPIQSAIGSNCRFLNKGMPNDPETMKELREIQASPQAARQYMRNYPRGKQFLLLNARPCRMLPEGVTVNSEDPDPDAMIYFYNCLTIFAIEIKHDGRKTVVLIGLQCVLHNGMDVKVAEVRTKHIQDALTHPHKGVRHIFYHWCRVALGMYHEFHEWNAGGTGSPCTPGSKPLSSGSSSGGSTRRLKEEFPFSRNLGSSERSASRESPKNGRVSSVGTTATGGGSSQTMGTSAAWSGSQQSQTQTSSGLGSRNDCSSSNGSEAEVAEAAEGEHAEVKEGAAEPAQGSVEHAKALLRRVRECERMAMLWAENNEEEERDSRVQELVDLREGLCDDFAADLQLYIAYHSLQCGGLECDGGDEIAAQ